MTDPALEARYRALDIFAARGVLKPIRELHRPVRQYAHPDAGLDCLECRKPWPCHTAHYCYTTVELTQ